MAPNARLEELKKKFDENPRRYFAPLANELRKQGDLPQAISLCRTHLPNQPGHISGHIVLGQALFEAQELTESRQILEQSLELDPENLIALRTLGDIARTQNDSTSARSWYERVLEVDPRNDEISALLREIAAAAAAALVTAYVPPAEPEPVAFADLAAEPDVAIEPEVAAESEFVDPGIPSWDPDKTPLTNVAIAELPDTFEATELSFEPSELAETVEVSSVAAEAESLADLGLVDLPDNSVSEPPSSEAETPELITDLVAPETPTDVAQPVLLESQAEAPNEEVAFEEDVDAFAVAQHLSDPEAHPAQYADDWFIAPTPPRGSQSVADSAPPPVPALAEETFTQPVSEEKSETAPLSVDFDAFDLIAHGSDVERAPAPEAPEEVAPTSSNSEDANDALDYTGWFDEPAQATPVIAAAEEESIEVEEPREEVVQETQSEASIELVSASEPEPPVIVEETVAEVVEFEPVVAELETFETLAPAVIVEETVAEVVELEPVAEELESFETPAPPHVEMEAEPEPEPFERGFVGEVDASEPQDIPEEAAASSLTEPAAEVVAEASSGDSLPEMFVTETMAELYLQQGFTDEALQVYRKLLDRNPEDEAIRARIAALAAGPESKVHEEPAAAPANDRAGRTVRSFFGHIARRQPAPRPQAKSALDVESLGAQYASRQANADAPVPSPTLTELFADAQRREEDDAAAQRLSAAFGPSESTGRPTRAAESELSLDHLFRDVQPESSSAVTLDAFFAAPGSDTSDASETASSAGEEERTGDIEQFTAWLEGLKKK